MLAASAIPAPSPLAARIEHRPAGRHRDVAEREARPRERGGQQRLEPAGGLLGVHPQDRLDREAGADQRHRQQRDREVVVDQAAGRLREELVHLLAVAEEAVGVLGGQADRQPAEEDPRRPGGQRPAQQAQREPDRTGERRRGLRRPGPRRDQAGAVVAAGEHRPGGDDQDDGRAEQQRQRPPALAGVRAHRLAPADRRQPRQRAVAHVAGGAQRVRGAEHRAGEPVRAGRASGRPGRPPPPRPRRRARRPPGPRRARSSRRPAGRRRPSRARPRRPSRAAPRSSRSAPRSAGRSGSTTPAAHQLAAAALLLGRACGGRR